MRGIGRFGRDTAFYAVGNIALRGASLLLTPVYTINLSVGGYGLLASLYATAEFLLIFMSLGMRTALIRFAKESNEDGSLGALMGSTIAINLAGGIVVSGLAFLALPPLFRVAFDLTSPHPYVLAVCGTALSRSVFMHLVAYYRARNNPVGVVIPNVVAALLLVVITLLLFVVLDRGVLGAMWANVISYAFMALVVGVRVLRETGFRLCRTVLARALRFGFPLVFSMASWPLISTSSIYLLGSFAGLSAVGVFALGQKLCSVAKIVLVLPFQMAFLPFAVAQAERDDLRQLLGRLLTYVLAGGIAVVAALLVGARFILPYIAPPEYATAFLVALALTPTVFSNALSVFGDGLLSMAQRTGITGSVSAVISILGLGVCAAAIPAFGVAGVLIVVNAVTGAMGISVLVLGHRHFPFDIEWPRLRFLLGVFIAVAVTAGVGYFAAATAFYLGMAVLLGLVGCWMYFGEFFVPQERAFIGTMARSLTTNLTSGRA